MTLPVMQPSAPCGDACRCRKPDSRLVEALRAELEQNCLGRENARTWEWLLSDLNRYPYDLDVKVVRRVQEAAEVLRQQDCPVVGLSSGGVFWARTVDELDEAIEEKRKRARTSFASLKRLRRARARMLGQAEVA